MRGGITEFALHIYPDHLDVVELGVAAGEQNQVTASGTEHVFNVWALSALDVWLSEQGGPAFGGLHSFRIESTLRQDPNQPLRRPIGILIVVRQGSQRVGRIKRDVVGRQHRRAVVTVFQVSFAAWLAR